MSRVPDAVQRALGGAPLSRDRTKGILRRDPGSAKQRHSASKTRVNALEALHRARETKVLRRGSRSVRGTSPGYQSPAISSNSGASKSIRRSRP
jgi:hypothetical protein